jgi:hypothetical protein
MELMVELNTGQMYSGYKRLGRTLDDSTVTPTNEK